jgi:hypothetical protein
MPFIEETVKQGMVTQEKVNVKLYRSGQKKSDTIKE